MTEITLVVAGGEMQGYETISNQPTTAIPSPHSVRIDNQPVAFRAFNIVGYNFFMLRDIAYVLNGSPSQFEVTWNGELNAINLTRGVPYTVTGSEMGIATGEAMEATPTTSRVFVNGTQVELRAYNIGGNNFFRLRDLGEALGFGVDWEPVEGVVLIETRAYVWEKAEDFYNVVEHRPHGVMTVRTDTGEYVRVALSVPRAEGSIFPLWDYERGASEGTSISVRISSFADGYGLIRDSYAPVDQIGSQTGQFNAYCRGINANGQGHTGN